MSFWGSGDSKADSKSAPAKPKGSSVNESAAAAAEEARESGPRERNSRSSSSYQLTGDNQLSARDEWRLIQWAQNAAAAARAKFRLSEERRPEVPRYVVVGVTALAVLSVLTGFGANNVCNFAGFIYPLYMSWKAVRTVDSTDDTQWLTYWVVYGFLNVTESWTRMFGLTSLPFYSMLKVCFLVWCFLPKTRGAQFIFHRVITPLLVKYEQRIDRFAQWWVGETHAAARDVMNQTSGELQRRVSKIGGNFLRAITDSVNDMKSPPAAPAAIQSAPAAAAGGGAPPPPYNQSVDQAAANLISAVGRSVVSSAINGGQPPPPPQQQQPSAPSVSQLLGLSD